MFNLIWTLFFVIGLAFSPNEALAQKGQKDGSLFANSFEKPKSQMSAGTAQGSFDPRFTAYLAYLDSVLSGRTDLTNPLDGLDKAEAKATRYTYDDRLANRVLTEGEVGLPALVRATRMLLLHRGTQTEYRADEEAIRVVPDSTTRLGRFARNLEERGLPLRLVRSQSWDTYGVRNGIFLEMDAFGPGPHDTYQRWLRNEIATKAALMDPPRAPILGTRIVIHSYEGILFGEQIGAALLDYEVGTEPNARPDAVVTLPFLRADALEIIRLEKSRGGRLINTRRNTHVGLLSGFAEALDQLKELAVVADISEPEELFSTEASDALRMRSTATGTRLVFPLGGIESLDWVICDIPIPARAPSDFLEPLEYLAREARLIEISITTPSQLNLPTLVANYERLLGDRTPKFPERCSKHLE